MINIERAYEFANMYYDWVCDCLTKDEKYEELVFFKLGVDLAVRQSELIDINFNQIEFPYVTNIEVKKLNMIRPSYYEPKEISSDTYVLLMDTLYDENKDKIFNKSLSDYIISIMESIGDENFNGHMMRKLGTILHFGE